MTPTDLPHLATLTPDRVSVHGTAVCLAGGEGVLIIGPPGAGKSGLAAQLIAVGAELVSDDLVIVTAGADALVLGRPDKAPPLLEARGLGLLKVSARPSAPLKALLSLSPSQERLPAPETLSLMGQVVPVFRHPYTFDLAAKISLRPWQAGV